MQKTCSRYCFLTFKTNVKLKSSVQERRPLTQWFRSWYHCVNLVKFWKWFFWREPNLKKTDYSLVITSSTMSTFSTVLSGPLHHLIVWIRGSCLLMSSVIICHFTCVHSPVIGSRVNLSASYINRVFASWCVHLSAFLRIVLFMLVRFRREPWEVDVIAY